MVNREQRGESGPSLLAILALIGICLLWGGWTSWPVEPGELQAVIALAEKSPAAKSALASALKETPNPTLAEFAGMRRRVNDIIVTEAARIATGDTTLQPRFEQDAIRQRQAADRLAAIKSKPWGEMSNEERAELMGSKLPFLLTFVFAVGFGLFGWRAVKQAQRGWRMSDEND